MHPILSAKRFCRAHGPALWTIGGVAALLVGEGLACWRTLHAAEAYKEYKEAEEQNYSTPFKDDEDRLNRGKVTLHNNIELAKHIVINYAPTAALTVAGILMIKRGHDLQGKRVAAVAAAYNALLAAVEAYRDRVREDVGEEKESEYAEGIFTVGSTPVRAKEISDSGMDPMEAAFKTLHMDPGILGEKFLTVCINRYTSEDWNWDKNSNLIMVEGRMHDCQRRYIVNGEISVAEQLLLLGCKDYVRQHPELYCVGSFMTGHELAMEQRAAKARGEELDILNWKIYDDCNCEFFDSINNNQDQDTNYLWVTIPIRGCLFTDGPFSNHDDDDTDYIHDSLNDGAILSNFPQMGGPSTGPVRPLPGPPEQETK